MRSSKEIKKELHEYIDNIEDEETLWMVREDLVEYLKKEKLEEEEEEDYLTEDQKQQLNEAIRQAEAGEFITEEEYQKATERWRTK
jgi:predicted transcriptional regulator